MGIVGLFLMQARGTAKVGRIFGPIILVYFATLAVLGVTNIMASSLYQHQKHVTLDGHVYSLHAYLVSDRFYNTLTDVEKKAVSEGIDKAKKIHRDMTREQDLSAKKVLAEKGMTVTELTPAEIDRFRKAAQPVVQAYLEAEVSKEWTQKLLAATAAK